MQALPEFSFTDCAFKRPFTSVRAHMNSEVVFISETLTTIRAFM